MRLSKSSLWTLRKWLLYAEKNLEEKGQPEQQKGFDLYSWETNGKEDDSGESAVDVYQM
jgi:hypothetical protein